ncbi:putative GATA transcription factor 22 [Chenopodium quinoa]|uniref:putative GATA transcription factor 22 n=1 Tax=Chenopodium quinoa TaxID=63459 RepID=UPI000B796572|nr:putative GATA transcription factor 22 [Chenopodium quinoa]
MSPVYLNHPQTSSPIPFFELKGDHTQHSFQVFGHLHHEESHNRDEILSLDYSRHEQKKVGKLVLSHENKANDLGQPCSPWLQNTIGDDSGCSYGYSFKAKIETPVNYNNDQNKYSRSKWKPSKVRIMQKIATSKDSRDSKKQLDHDLSKRQNNDGIRVCSDCHTTTTPLWRSGPQGPKSLCNACGIRQRKARRAAMAAAAAAGFGNDNAVVPSISPLPVETPKPKVQVIKTEKGLDDNNHHDKSHTLPLKKRSKVIDAARNNNNYTHNNTSNNAKKLCFEDFALSSNMDYLKANSKRSFPRDEEEGAILLMALSCGLACSL